MDKEDVDLAFALDDLKREMDEYLNTLKATIVRNRKMIEDLPPGTIVRIQGQPDRTRETLLELML